MITGLNLLEAVGIGAYYGAGMEVTNGAGASIFTGASLYDYNGIYTQVGRWTGGRKAREAQLSSPR